MEEALHDIPLYREFAHLDAGISRLCDESTIVNWHIYMMPSEPKVMDTSRPVSALLDQLEKLKASIRAKVEHPFRVIKCQFGYRKVRYHGLAKNTNQLLVMFAMSNLWMARKRMVQGLRA